MSESTQNEGKTVLQLDEKTMDQLRSGGYLLVAFEGGNAKLKLANLQKIDNVLNASSNNPVTNSAITAVIGDVETLLASL